MIRTIHPKPLESEEIGSFDRTIAITRYGMRLLGFWPQDTRFLCDLQCGMIFVLIGFFLVPAAVRMYTVVYTVTDWNSVMRQALHIIPIIPLLARFVFMKVMARNFRFILHTMTVDWANYRHLAKKSRRIMTYYAKRGRRFSILSTVLMMLSITGKKSDDQVIVIIKFSLDDFLHHILYILTICQTFSSKPSKQISTFAKSIVNPFLYYVIDSLVERVLGLILTPVVNMWRNDGFWNATIRILPHEGYYPFRNKESPVYEILYVAQSFSTFFSATALATVDSFLYVIVFHICGQLDILAAILKQYNGSIRHHYTKDACNCACISCIVKRHVHILK